MRPRGIFRIRRGWRRDRRGVAAIEFAMIMPLLLALYLGGYETAQAMATYRKMAATTVELANITAQYTTMSSSDMTSVMNASAQIMAPYSTTNLSIVMSEITTDANSHATVTWSNAYNGGAALTPGAAFTLPSGLVAASTSYVLVRTVYSYVPTVGSAFVHTIPMTDQIYMLPRQSSSITYTG